MNKLSQVIAAMAAFAAILCAAPRAVAGAPAVSSFESASFSGVSITPFLQSGTLTYTVALNSSPTITIGTSIYEVAWVGGFYAVGTGEDSSFVTTTGASVDGWNWDSEAATGGGYVAGWTARGNDNRIFAEGNAKHFASSNSFTFGSFQITSPPVITGVHVAYMVPDQTVPGKSVLVTDFRLYTQQPNPSPVPEPSTVLASSMLLAPAAALMRRRR